MGFAKDALKKWDHISLLMYDTRYRTPQFNRRDPSDRRSSRWQEVEAAWRTTTTFEPNVLETPQRKPCSQSNERARMSSTGLMNVAFVKMRDSVSFYKKILMSMFWGIKLLEEGFYKILTWSVRKVPTCKKSAFGLYRVRNTDAPPSVLLLTFPLPSDSQTKHKAECITHNLPWMSCACRHYWWMFGRRVGAADWPKRW